MGGLRRVLTGRGDCRQCNHSGQSLRAHLYSEAAVRCNIELHGKGWDNCTLAAIAEQVCRGTIAELAIERGDC